MTLDFFFLNNEPLKRWKFVTISDSENIPEQDSQSVSSGNFNAINYQWKDI